MKAAIRTLIAEMHEEETFCQKSANDLPSKAEHYLGYAGGLMAYRTRLETLLTDTLHSTRPVIIDQ
ncbi:hypothetical protein HUO09_17770 [Vibrio sp. Y2-5]|uniref:hypothetical protein n=1 Tax=Vibrio sp. Y2-5 TaxID=2743977 RepID=UPI0016612277|nr:hypothetical protein [Vibrio sp. Y2-5]MBD0788207.1 hypothetical protein [Vibrio sp. Y2-5]